MKKSIYIYICFYRSKLLLDCFSFFFLVKVRIHTCSYPTNNWKKLTVNKKAKEFILNDIYMQLKNNTQVRILIHFYNIMAELITYLYLILKIYRVLCFSKITFDQMPRINPYKWPFSFIRIATGPYFKFWSILMPKLRIGSGSYDISSIIGLEMLSTLISTSYKLRLFILLQIERLLQFE